MSAGSGGVGPFKLSDRLTNEHRACLLRAARNQLLKLADDHDRLVRLAGDDVGGMAAADSASIELHCLQQAVAWLWRDQLANDN